MNKNEIEVDLVATRILLIRGKRVMLDRDLATMYEVATKVLNQAVKRNKSRFPSDFMFQLSESEQFELVTNCDQFKSLKHSSSRSCVFTEQGVAMLSSVLNSERAIEVNIAIMRAFVRMREILLTNKDLAAKIEALELKYKNHDMKFSENDVHISAIFEVIKQLMMPAPVLEKPKIGFHS